MIKAWIACLFLLTVPGLAVEPGSFFPIEEGLIVDLNADSGVIAGSENRVEKWMNQVRSFPAGVFEKTDVGREMKGSGMPLLKTNVAEINGHSSIVFHQQELLSDEEDAFDHLITGSGYTWFCVVKAGKQPGELKDVNSIFGNLRNGGHYEGFWAGLMDNNQPWMGSRNGLTFGRWDNNNPRVLGKEQLRQQGYYLLIGHMTKGTGQAMLSLYVNDAKRPVATGPFPVNPQANASKLAIGQERDATEHPGVESFAGEIARFLLYERPLSRKELIRMAGKLMKYYHL
ncbi:concanavalin A-like lectin/glucanase superfamily protein [Anseongella ginsenosidimutans]|uniref:Concanavalin A-like lectin/glucanase superfamily protein n=1 Tax=Anseongella ginsenosidimutans TaxID=496056 RepID=A0A4R3KX12_9SPHI|nr:LamG-like jellyroll fold domain-containing protein [Anseongella ginsenosidimutans]QEC53555.1 LamG domain-containing protein [Anseongella ginsenosidimutans]TCS88461.1 concanavalin A-like lectin/glucanase superfamily protein [Anseongella ginsenosidimutans]